MDTIKLFFELVNEQFIGEFVEDIAVKETERLHNNIEIGINDGYDLRGPLSQVTGKMEIIDRMMLNHKKQLNWK